MTCTALPSVVHVGNLKRAIKAFCCMCWMKYNLYLNMVMRVQLIDNQLNVYIVKLATLLHPWSLCLSSKQTMTSV